MTQDQGHQDNNTDRSSQTDERPKSAAPGESGGRVFAGTNPENWRDTAGASNTSAGGDVAGDRSDESDMGFGGARGTSDDGGSTDPASTTSSQNRDDGGGTDAGGHGSMDTEARAGAEARVGSSRESPSPQDADEDTGNDERSPGEV